MPRKKTDNKTTKDEVVNVRMTSQQKEILEVFAARRGLGVSTFLLNTGLTFIEKENA